MTWLWKFDPNPSRTSPVILCTNQPIRKSCHGHCWAKIIA